jgi:hypothetical protein
MKALLTIVGIVILFAVGAAAFVWTGMFNIAATEPHWEITSELIGIVRDRSIAVHSQAVSLPPFDEKKLLPKGVEHYHEMCRICHGAPGQPPELFAQGLYPGPANLLSGDVQAEWSDRELFWIIENGLKMTGMPAFGPTHERDELQGMVAFLRRLPKLSPEEYAELVRKAGGGERTGANGHVHGVSENEHHHGP